MFGISRKSIFIYSLWFITVCAFIAVFIFYFKKNQNALNFSLGLLGIFAMLSIASQTFLNMNKSTKETVDAILKASEEQIKEFGSLVGKLEVTNVTLDGVSESLKIVAGDVLSRQKLIPNLYVTFIKSQNQIDLISGNVCEIELYLHNGGVVNAGNPNWSVFFPPQIEIIDVGHFTMIPQGIGTRHENYTSLSRNKSSINARTQIPYKIKIRTSKTNIGLVKIPFMCSCDNAPQGADNLLINFIGS